MPNKPNNWWNMDYNERKEWERNQQALEDAEYDKRRAQEEADNAQAEAQRLRREMRAESYAAQEEYSILQDELSTLNTNYERILAERNELRDMLKEQVEAMQEAVSQFGESRLDEQEREWLTKAATLLDKIRGD